MSALIFNERKNINFPLEVAPAPAATFTDVVTSSFKDRFLSELSVSKDLAIQDALDGRAKKYKELTGRSLQEDVYAGEPLDVQARAKRAGNPLYDSEEFKERADKYILNLRNQDPEKYAAVESGEEILNKVKENARNSRKASQKAAAGASNFNAVAGSIVGSMGAEFVDPVNLYTMPLGLAKGAGLIKTMLFEAGVNMGAEVLKQPEVIAWQKELGHEYGWGDAFENIALAGGAGAGFGMLAKGISDGLPRAFKTSSEVFEGMKGKFKEWGAPQKILDILEHQSRLTHLENGNPFKDSPDLDNGRHAKALLEVDAAMREGRPIRTENLGIEAHEISKIESSGKVTDSILAKERVSAIEDLKAKPSELPSPRDIPFNPKEDFHPDVFPDSRVSPDEVKTLADAAEVRARDEMHPENRAVQDADLEKYLSNPESENVQIEVDGKKTDAASFKKELTKQKSWVEAIKVCAIPGGE
jgi:hypothetical protein